MAGCALCYARFKSSVSEPTLKNRFMQVMTTLFTRDPINVMTGGGKYPLPSPLLCRVRVFALESVEQSDSPEANS